MEEQSEIDILKQEVKILKSKLEREMEQRQEERKEHEAKVVSYEKIREESVRFHDDLHSKLEETIQQKALAEKQLREFAQQNEHSHTEEIVDKFNKEFHRRKQLEEDLGKERQQLKQVNVALEKEILKRQQLEQEMRVWQLSTEAEVRERNQEHEIQRRQLQQAVEMEVQRRKDLTEKLENEMKQRQEETQRRLRLEVQLQEEIQVRTELLVEFKQAELQNQLLEQELREDLRQMEHVFRSDENAEVEVVSLDDREEESSTGENCSDTRSSGEVSDKAEERGGAGDNDKNENDEEERSEIRQLLLEEFERLQSQQDKRKESTDVNEVIRSRYLTHLSHRFDRTSELCKQTRYNSTNTLYFNKYVIFQQTRNISTNTVYFNKQGTLQEVRYTPIYKVYFKKHGIFQQRQYISIYILYCNNHVIFQQTEYILKNDIFQ